LTAVPENGSEAQRRAAAINDLLGRIGLSDGSTTERWNHQTYPELGGKTPTQAWLAGDHVGVRSLIDKWYAETERSIAENRRDPKYMATLRQQIDALNAKRQHAS
jgi:hypothetical protein